MSDPRPWFARFTAFAALLASLLAASSQRAVAQTLGCTVGVGNGGSIPLWGAGGGGVYPTTLPSPLTNAVFVLDVPTLPPGAAFVTEVKLIGLSHTWLSNCQFVLTDPSGAAHNVFNRFGYFDCNFGGDYTIVPRCTGGLGEPVGGCHGSAVLTPGVYSQSFGDWPSGSSSIFNTPLETVPAQVGTWTLSVYDWSGTNSGWLDSFDLCFGAPPPLTPPVTAPTLLAPSNGAAFCANQISFTWSAVECATSYDLDLNGVVRTGITGGSFSTFFSSSGVQTWRVRATNTQGSSAYSAPRSFVVGPLLGWACSTGGLGGTIPIAGAVNGSWPTTLPTGAFQSSLSVSVPSGATKLAAIRLNGFEHTWSGDCQIVLSSPSGARYTLFQDMDGVVSGGCGGRFLGDYLFVDPTNGVDLCGAPALTFACVSGNLPQGAYRQHFGAWPSGVAGIDNANLSSIPLASGVWTLSIYDWFVGFSDGTLDSWDLCFDGGLAAPIPFCTAGLSTGGCVASISATALPSASLSSPCVFQVQSVEPQRSGLVFYGINNSGFTPLTWSAGSSSFLCVKPPVQRMPVQSSGGVLGACNGALTQDWTAFQSSHSGTLGAPFTAGDKVFAQAWFRDPPAAKSTNLSNALELTLLP